VSLHLERRQVAGDAKAWWLGKWPSVAEALKRYGSQDRPLATDMPVGAACVDRSPIRCVRDQASLL
jgi:hypothetical protein